MKLFKAVLTIGVVICLSGCVGYSDQYGTVHLRPAVVVDPMYPPVYGHGRRYRSYYNYNQYDRCSGPDAYYYHDYCY